MGQIKFVGGLIMTAIFTICIILFMVSVGNENNAAFNLNSLDGWNDTQSSITGNLTTYQTETINATDSFYSSEIQEVSQTSLTGGQFKLGPGTALKTVNNAMRQGFKSIFGDDSSNFGFILGTLILFLSSVLALVIWKTWKGGNPE